MIEILQKTHISISDDIKEFVMTLTNWSTEEIEDLKIFFLKGESIKLMARYLNRTPTSVNKALTRFSIRTPRKYIEKKIKTEATKAYNRERHQKFEKVKWISIKDVVHYLLTKGYNIIQPSEHCQKPLEFILNRRPLTPLQLVMIANQERLKNNEDVFLVDNVTW